MDRLLTIMFQMTGKNTEELRKIIHNELDELEREVNAMKELLKVKPDVAVSSSKAPVVKKGVKKTVVVANDVIHTEVNPVVNTDNDVAKDTTDVLNATVVTALVTSKEEEKKKPNSKTTGGRKKTAVASEASVVTVTEGQGQPHITDEHVKKNEEAVVEKEKKTRKTSAKKVSPSVTTTDTTNLKTNEIATATPTISVAPATEINTTESVVEKQTKETKKQQNKKEKNTSTEKPKSKGGKNKESVTESVVTSDQQPLQQQPLQQQPSQQQPSQQQMSTSLLEIQTQSSLLGEQEQEQQEEEEVEVEEFVYDGVLYLKSLKGVVYDIETSEEIGIWNETTKSICVD